MKRHPALHELSRDHHHGLARARELRQARAGNARACAQAMLDFWRRELSLHFREEEEILLPIAARRLPADDTQLVRVAVEHMHARRLILQIERAESDSSLLETLGELGVLLEAHIRFEERELFPRLERALTEPDLEELQELIASAPRARACLVRARAEH